MLPHRNKTLIKMENYSPEVCDLVLWQILIALKSILIGVKQ